MSTLIALIKLHAYKLASYWDNSLENSDRPLALTDALPPFLTIPTDDERAKMQVGEIPHGQLKKRYEENLAASVPLLLSRLSELDPAFEGDITYRVVNYEGSDTREGPGNRTGDERGGLKVVFRDAGGTDIASVWMRGSGTEPVFRVMADCAGTNTDVLDTLIEWQRREVARAAAL
jgi:phosphomannomutase